MSNRTLIEINHDFAHDIERDPEGFVRALLNHLRSVDYSKLPRSPFPGVSIIGTKHHTEPHFIRWGAYGDECGTVSAIALTEQDRRFLNAVASNGRLPSATREQDKARQRCRKAGLVVFGAGKWHLTDAGRAALAARS